MKDTSPNSQQSDRSLKAISDRILHSGIVQALKIVVFVGGLIVTILPVLQLAVRIATGIATLALGVIFIVQATGRRVAIRVAHKILTKEYGYEYKAQIIKGILDRDDGAMHLTRQVHVTATTVHEKIRHYLHSMDENPQHRFGLREVEKISPRSVEITGEQIEEPSRPNRMLIQVNFDPPLGPGDSAVYRVPESFPSGSFATSFKEIDEGPFECEYLSWHINKPTRHLELQVSIPLALDPTEYDYDVWYAGFSRQRHKAEFERVEGCFTCRTETTDGYACQVLNLDVPYPTLGLVYVLKWSYTKKEAPNR